MAEIDKIKVEDLSDIQILYYLHKVHGYEVVSSKLNGRTGPNGETLFRGSLSNGYSRFDQPLYTHLGQRDSLIYMVTDAYYDIEYQHDDANTWEVSSKSKSKSGSELFVSKSSNLDQALRWAVLKRNFGEMVDNV